MLADRTSRLSSCAGLRPAVVLPVARREGYAWAMTSSFLGSPCAGADDDSVAELSYSGDVGAAQHRIRRCISMHGLSRSCAGAGLALDERNAEVEIRRGS